MRFLLLGAGEEESAWAEAIRACAGHELLAVWPETPFHEPNLNEIDAPLALQGVDAVIVGGPISFRDQALRKVAAAGFHAIALHPPGPNADAYYQVALSREETGSIVVPDLPQRLSPSVVELKQAIVNGMFGAPLELLLDVQVEPGDDDLVGPVFSRWADLIRHLLGEATTILSFGEPTGMYPSRSLTAQLRSGESARAEVRISRGATPLARLTATGPRGSTTLDLGLEEGFDPRQAILAEFENAVARKPSHPDLVDGTRAMELAEGVGRSLRRGRTLDLHYEQVSEANNFKSVMTSIGCMILLACLVALPMALAGPALGMNWMLYIAYAIPPLLVFFALTQLLKYGVKPPKAVEKG